MACTVNGTEIILSGTVGVRDYFDDGFTYNDVIGALAQVGRDANINVRINSGGGVATEGAAIHALLQGHKGRVDITIEGVAASAASLIAMAGRTSMAAGAVLMIHNPSIWTSGDIVEHERTVAYLRSLNSAYAGIYADKANKPVDDVLDLMTAETWFTADQAVEAGFADRALAAGPGASDLPVSAFPYAAYAHAPKAIMAMAQAKGWTPESFKAASAAPIARKETRMSAKTTAEQAPAPITPAAPAAVAQASLDDAVKTAVAEDRARRAAIMTLADAAGREALAEHLWSTGASVEVAKATLSVAPKATPASDYEATRQPIASGLASPGGAPDAAAGTIKMKAVMAKAVARANKR